MRVGGACLRRRRRRGGGQRRQGVGRGTGRSPEAGATRTHAQAAGRAWGGWRGPVPCPTTAAGRRLPLAERRRNCLLRPGRGSAAAGVTGARSARLQHRHHLGAICAGIAASAAAVEGGAQPRDRSRPQPPARTARTSPSTAASIVALVRGEERRWRAGLRRRRDHASRQRSRDGAKPWPGRGPARPTPPEGRRGTASSPSAARDGAQANGLSDGPGHNLRRHRGDLPIYRRAAWAPPS